MLCLHIPSQRNRERYLHRETERDTFTETQREMPSQRNREKYLHRETERDAFTEKQKERVSRYIKIMIDTRD